MQKSAHIIKLRIATSEKKSLKFENRYVCKRAPINCDQNRKIAKQQLWQAFSLGHLYLVSGWNSGSPSKSLRGAKAPRVSIQR